VSNWLQAGKMYQNDAEKFSAFAEENDKRTIFLKNETTKTLLETVKTSILESEKNTAPRAKPVCSGCA
jgi:ABC-type Zn uptake system ZnuABC Zn-binding protein ZnuA